MNCRMLAGAVAMTLLILIPAAEADAGSDVPAVSHAQCPIIVGEGTLAGGFDCPVVITSTNALGATVQQQCAPEEFCVVEHCTTYIADDAIYAPGGGLRWNSADKTPPIRPGEAVPTFGPAPDFVSLVFGDEGYFSPTGRWVSCQALNVKAHGTQDTNGAWNPVTQTLGYEYYPDTGPAIALSTLRLAAYVDATPPGPPQGRAPLVGPALVKIPTWFWVGSDYWNENRIGTAADGVNNRVRVDVYPTPVHTTWDTGEGTVTCAGETQNTQTWVPNTNLDPYTDGTCTHTYNDATVITPNGHYDLVATTHFTAYMQLTVNGTPGIQVDLEPYDAVTTGTIEVEEILSVAVSPNGPSAMAQLIAQGSGE